MWTAIVLGALVALGLYGYASWAAYLYAHGVSAWLLVAGLPVAYLVFPLFFTSVWVAVGWWMRAKRPAEFTLTFGQRVKLFFDEFLSIAMSAPKMILYRLLIRDPPPAPAALPVLLLHGVGCNAGVWAGLRHYLNEQDLGPVYALSYGPPLAGIESFAPQVAAKIEAIRAATGAEQVVIVCHSMGGLVARTYLRRFGGKSVRRLITIGTPHFGSMHAWMMGGASVLDMRPGSPYLASLNESADYAAGVPIVSLWSWHDSMVTPQTSSRLDWAQNIVLSGVAHNALLNNHEVWKSVASELRKARAQTPTNESPASVEQTPSVPG